MDKFNELKDRVVEIVSESNITWTDDELKRLSMAIVNIEEVNHIAEEDGLLCVDGVVNTIDEAPHLKDLLLKAVYFKQNAKDFDILIKDEVSHLRKGVDSAIAYIYILGAYSLQVMDKVEFYTAVTSLVPSHKKNMMNVVYQNVLTEKNSLVVAEYMINFFTVDTYTNDEILESYIDATCEEIKELTDKDVLYLYEKNTSKFNEFLEYADKEFRFRLLTLVNSVDVRLRALNIGKMYGRNRDNDGRMKIYPMDYVTNLILDIHENIYIAYSAGELEGGSDKIIYPKIKERNISDKLRNMGF